MKPRLKRFVAKPTSLVVSFHLDGEFKEFIVRKFPKNYSTLSPQVKAVRNTAEKAEQPLSHNTWLKFEEQVKKKFRNSDVKQTTKEGPCTTSSGSMVSDKSHPSKLAPAVPENELEGIVAEDIDEAFRLLEEEVDAIQSPAFQKEENVCDPKNTTSSPSKELLSDGVKRKTLKRRRRQIFDSSSDEECADTNQVTVICM